MKSKKPVMVKSEGHFNVAEFSEKRTLVREKYKVPGTDSIAIEEYYVWLLPE